MADWKGEEGLYFPALELQTAHNVCRSLAHRSIMRGWRWPRETALYNEGIVPTLRSLTYGPLKWWTTVQCSLQLWKENIMTFLTETKAFREYPGEGWCPTTSRAGSGMSGYNCGHTGLAFPAPDRPLLISALHHSGRLGRHLLPCWVFLLISHKHLLPIWPLFDVCFVFTEEILRAKDNMECRLFHLSKNTCWVRR